MKRGNILARLGVVMLLACWISVWSGGVLSAAEEAEGVPDIVERVAPAVVAIIGKPGDTPGLPSNRFDLAHGTGVIVTADGYIVTNAHVVADMDNLLVVTADGKSYSGRTTHVDDASDLALVKIEAGTVQPAEFAGAGDIRVGETVIAIGTPVSFALRNSVTVGIVSGVDRTVQGGYPLLQTDAAINPGNSGGALVNMRGQIVGINTLKVIDSSVDSVGFAIPADTVRHVVEHFLAYGKVMRPYTGIEIEESWESVVGLPTNEALRIGYVDPGSPAAAAGIRQGDTLLAIDGHGIPSTAALYERMRRYVPGQTIQVELVSEGVPVTREVTLGEEDAGQTVRPTSSTGAAIDSDRGKSMIGDSHYGWSMRYPAGLIRSNQSDSGNEVLFTDSKGEYAIHIVVEDNQSEDLSGAGLLRKVLERSGELVLEKRVVDSGGTVYAKVVGKTKSSAYFEMRAYLQGSRVYYATMIVMEESNYKNSAKQQTVVRVLDSFRTAFDAADESVKDLSVRKGDGVRFVNEYGLSFELPPGWTEDRYAEDLSYSDLNATMQVTIRVTSASSGDTLEVWTERERQRFLDSYVEAHRTTSDWGELSLAGSGAREIRYAWAMGDEWDSRHALYWIRGGYKYELSLLIAAEDEGEDSRALLERLKSSLALAPDASNSSLSVMQDERELLDPERTVTVRSSKYNYSLRIPETWDTFSGYPGSQEGAYEIHYFTGGMLAIEVEAKGRLDDTVSELEQTYREEAEDSRFTFKRSGTTALGQRAVRFEVEDRTGDAPYKETVYVLAHGGNVYTVTLQMYDAVRTDANYNRLQQAFRSMKLGT